MEQLRRMRDAAGFTRARLARLSGVSAWRIAQAELEQYELSPEEVRALRQVLRPELVRLAHVLLEFQSSS